MVFEALNSTARLHMAIQMAQRWRARLIWEVSISRVGERLGVVSYRCLLHEFDFQVLAIA